MSSKTQTAYHAVLSHFTELIDASKVNVVLSDYETAIRNVVEELFPTARIVGCNVHYDRVSNEFLLKIYMNRRLNV